MDTEGYSFVFHRLKTTSPSIERLHYIYKVKVWCVTVCNNILSFFIRSTSLIYILQWVYNIPLIKAL